MRAAAERRVGERARARCIAGSPARRRGNFLLSCQKKVTKEEALNRTRAPHGPQRRVQQPAWHAHKRAAALSRLTCDEAQASPHPSAQRAAARRAQQNSRMQRRSGGAVEHHSLCRRPSDAVFVVSGEPGVQPALSGMKVRCLKLFTGTAARAQRLASARYGGGRFRAPLTAASRWCAVQRLSFGDFSLARQRKVTRPPGRTPGKAPSRRSAATHQPSNPATRQPQNSTTERIDSPRRINSNPSLICSSFSLCVISSSMRSLPSMYQSTILGTSVRPRAPPKAEPSHFRPVTNWNGRVEISAPAGATPMMMLRPQPLCVHSSAWRISCTLPTHSKE
mmetsp:Transcript_20810/g.79791  ORF Transcript_20810/g.79791 Transcript_20810/m.79791 type:complete len:336 (+) Transcript_20810:880-1887(+)